MASPQLENRSVRSVPAESGTRSRTSGGWTAPSRPGRLGSSGNLANVGGNKKQVTFQNTAGSNPIPEGSSIRTRAKRKTTTGLSGALSGDEENERQAKRGHHARGPLRKRSYSFSEGHNRSVNSVPPNKRWKNKRGKNQNKNQLPSKFLLGGNIRDPLNLNSLSDEKISKIVNAITPESSPLPTPKHRKAEYKIEVLIPPNISDPLNLNCGVDENEYESQLISPDVPSNTQQVNSGIVKRRRFRYRTRSRSNRTHVTTESETPLLSTDVPVEKASGTSSDPPGNQSSTSTTSAVQVEKTSSAQPGKSNNAGKDTSKIPPSSSQIKKRLGAPHLLIHHQKQLETEIVSPVIPQPGQNDQFEKCSKNQFQNSKNRFFNRKKKKSGDASKPTTAKPRFSDGNYNQYYGYRTPDQDFRLRHFKPDWFVGKDVLDVGCNIGCVTMAVASHFDLKSIVGVDIDPKLIETARRNLKRYQSCAKPDGETIFPQCLPDMFGPIDPTAEMEQNERFPQNVKFICADYVLDCDELLEATQQEFDVIMCLSTTKWIHLNHGDEGLKRAFKRMFAQLRPGGLLILEPQGFDSYRRRKKLSEKIYENFQSIKLMPENFSYYLQHEVGFQAGEVFMIPHEKKGFQRPVQLFSKRFPFSSRSGSSHQPTPSLGGSTTPYGGPSPMFPPRGRCYAPSLTPMYNKPSPFYPHQTPPEASPRAGPSNRVPDNLEKDNFSRPQDPPASASPGYETYMGRTPNYSPGDTPSYTGYSGYTPGRSGITPGYAGPSPEHYVQSPLSHSPVYSGPEPGAVSNSSTPGHGMDGDNLGAGYTPSHSAYTPSNPGTPNYSPRPQFSPGNATPRLGTPNSTSNPPSVSPVIQQSEITGNTTPHPGPSGSSPRDDERNPRYFWYGGSNSGGNTPQFSGHESPSSSQANIDPDLAQATSDDSNAADTNPNSPLSPFNNT